MADETEEKNKEQRTLENLLEKYGNDSLKLATQLLADNATLREKNRNLKEKVPAEGSQVVSAEDYQKLQSFNELGKTPEEIKKSLDRTTELETENARFAKRDKLREVEKLGWDLDVLEEKLEAFPNAEIQIKKVKDEKDKSKELDVPFVSLDGKESSLDDFAKENFPKYLPVLKVNQEAQPQRKAPIPPDPPPSFGADDESAKRASAAMAQRTFGSF